MSERPRPSRTGKQLRAVPRTLGQARVLAKPNDYMTGETSDDPTEVVNILGNKRCESNIGAQNGLIHICLTSPGHYSFLKLLKFPGWV